jgi:hypothetical protein
VLRTLLAETRIDLARLMPLEWSSLMVEMKVICRRLMISRRSSRHFDMKKPRIRLRTWAERDGHRDRDDADDETGHTAWVKWLTLKEMAVMPSGLALTPS